MKTSRQRHRICMMLVAATWLLHTGEVTAQNVTYNHDAAKMNQITVMGAGTGKLTPAAYYELLHRNYSESAGRKNKLSYRTQAGVNLHNQVDEAEALDSALTRRAEVEAQNVADRSGGVLDLAWLAEGSKLTAKMEDFEKNIRRILQAGGTLSGQRYWKEQYNMFQCAIRATQEAYMPNAQRKREYLNIYAEVARKNETLIHYIVRLSNAESTRELLDATCERNDNKAHIVQAAMNRWREAGWKCARTGE